MEVLPVDKSKELESIHRNLLWWWNLIQAGIGLCKKDWIIQSKSYCPTLFSAFTSLFWISYFLQSYWFVQDKIYVVLLPSSLMCSYMFSVCLSLLCFSFLFWGCHCIKTVLLSTFMGFYTVLHTIKRAYLSFLLLLINLISFDGFILKTTLFHSWEM